MDFISFLFILITILVIGNFNNGVVNKTSIKKNCQSFILNIQNYSPNIVFSESNSSLFDEFVCKLGLFWHTWAI
jgi:hypothetical protein